MLCSHSHGEFGGWGLFPHVYVYLSICQSIDVYACARGYINYWLPHRGLTRGYSSFCLEMVYLCSRRDCTYRKGKLGRAHSHILCRRRCAAGGCAHAVLVWGGVSWGYEQALVSLQLKKSIDPEGGRTFAVIIEGG